MIIKQSPTVRCKKCLKEYPIEANDFKGPTIRSDERKMGYEVQYTWTKEFVCEKCSNEIEIILEGYEYPQGFFNHEEYYYVGCLPITKAIVTTIPDYDDEIHN